MAFTLEALDARVALRASASPEESYTAKLIGRGVEKCAQKLGEEAVETVIAAKDPDDAAFAGEAADLLYHLIVLLHARDMNLATIARTLQSRHR